MYFSESQERVIEDTIGQMMEGQSVEHSFSLFDLVISGGWIMAILAVLSIVSIYIFIERMIVIQKASKYDGTFMNMIRDYIHLGKISEAKTLCTAKNTPTSRMLLKGISRLGRPLSDIQQTIENAGNLEVSRLEKKLFVLATTASAAPMLGFLGTVIGMIRAFYNMSMAGSNVDIEILASGIYQAMVTTVGGLIVGIIAYVSYNIVVSRVDKLVFRLENATTDFMDLLNEPAE